MNEATIAATTPVETVVHSSGKAAEAHVFADGAIWRSWEIGFAAAPRGERVLLSLRS